MRAPPIDQRSYQDLVAETEALAQRLSGWQPPPDGQPDAGRALIRIFGRFAELVVERINRAPDKSFLAFLNLIGTSMLPPQPARVPLTFQLAQGSPVDAVVPAGAQAAAPPPEGAAEEVVFETERELVVSRAQLQAVYTSDTETDTFADRTAAATGQVDQPFAVFGGDRPTAHHLYLAFDPLLTQPGPKDVTLTLATPDTWQWANWPITWAWWDGASWRAAAGSARLDPGAWRITFPALPPLPPHPVNGIEAGWLRAQLELPLPPGETGNVPESVAIGARNPEDLRIPLSPFPDTSTVKRFYLSADEAFAAAGARVRLQFGLARPGAATNLQLNWFYQAGDQWLPLGQSSAQAEQVGASSFAFRDGTLALTRDGEISFQVPMDWPRSLYRTRRGRWLRVDVAAGQYTTPPEVASLTAGFEWEPPRLGRASVTVRPSAPPEPLPPDAAFFNATPLDLGKDLYPLGEQPRFNDTFYVALPEALARPGAAVKLAVTLTNPAGATDAPVKPVRTEDRPAIAWEVSDGRRWRATSAAYALTTSGEVSITLPDPIAPMPVNGQERYWLRARLVAGHYGTAATYRQNPDGTLFRNADGSYVLLAATVAPPVVKSLSFTPVGAPQAQAPASACLGYNDFVYADHTAAAATGQGPAFTPFTPTADSEPALYLGFDRPFDTRPATLYLQVEPPRPEQVAAEELAEIDPTTLAQVTWEYAAPGGWRPLGALDETQALSSRDLVHFTGSKDLVARSCFGQPLYWLRARWQRGDFPLPPRLRRVLLNTTWAAQLTTVDDEILGSSNGNPGQTFTTAQAPVQPGQRVLVRERERPVPAEQQALAALEGADAVAVTVDAAGQPDEIWVRWHAVSDFHASGARDRHYTIDALTGEIRFGDGSSGMIPPQGQNNLRITYRTGGGEQGNQAAGTVVQLKSGIPYVDGVVNHEPAHGGAPREPIERLQARGPRVLRHRDRAITAHDLEDLAAEASVEVARVAAIVPTFNPYNLWLDPQAPAPTPEHAEADAGRMGVIVVPNDDAARPTPSLALLRRVRAHLQARCPPTADLWVAGPEWIAVTVEATVAPTSLEHADAVGDRVRTALERFLHPLTGGPGGQGWAFGRKPHRSDLAALLEAVEGVDHVRALAVSLQPETGDVDRRLALERLLQRPLTETSDQPQLERDLQRWLDRALVYSGRHQIEVALG